VEKSTTDKAAPEGEVQVSALSFSGSKMLEEQTTKESEMTLACVRSMADFIEARELLWRNSK